MGFEGHSVSVHKQISRTVCPQSSIYKHRQRARLKDPSPEYFNRDIIFKNYNVPKSWLREGHHFYSDHYLKQVLKTDNLFRNYISDWHYFL